MNTPGVSLFQGADTLKVNSTLERQEEEEAFQDQKRREEELGNLLENAFEDLDDDDEESTADSTTNFPSNILPVQPLPLLPPLSAQQQVPSQSDFVHANEMHKLKAMLESQTHELNNVNQIAAVAHKKIDEYQKRLSITQAELERALREKQHTHELLVDSKETCSNLENNVEKLRHDKKSLESENTQLVGKLETVQTLLSDVQRKYDMVERDTHRRDERNADMRIHQLEESKRAQAELMQQQVSKLTDQLDKKKQELDQMHMRYNALQTSHDAMLVDRADKINELTAARDVAQRRYNQLASKPDYEAEYTRQQKCIADLHGKVANMEQTIAQLTERANGTTAELDLMDTLLQQHQTELDSPHRLPSRLLGSTPLNPADRMGNIKQELYRALGNLKNKREEVQKLEKLLDERTRELQSLREEENKALVQLATLKENNMCLENRIKVLQEQMDERQLNSSFNVSKLQTEMDALSLERDALRLQIDTQSADRQNIDKQLKQIKLDFDELKLTYDNLKRNHDRLSDDNRQLRTRTTADNVRLELERHKILLKDAQGEVERLKILYTDIANEKETLSYQLRKLSETDSLRELQEMNQQVAQLQRNLQLAEVKSQELSKILDKEKLRHDRELQSLRDKLEAEKHDLVIRAKKEGANNCSKCIDQLAEITKIEIQMLKLQNLNSSQAAELTELKTELDRSKALHQELKLKAKHAVDQEKVIAELKAKAQEFEEQLQNAAKRSENTSPVKPEAASPVGPAEASPCSGVGDVNADTSPESPELTHARIKRIEQRVRDEMAKLFAAELKRFTIRLQQAEERSSCLQREYQLVCRELQKRQTEVELLKQTILAEREEMQELLGDKDDKQKHLMHKCRMELQAKNQRIAILLQEMEEQHASIESERRSMKTVMAEWEKQKQSIEQVEQHWCDQVNALHEAHEEALRAAQKRYQSAKRTAHNYKLYADDKEAHMKREYERIKQEYQTSLTQIEATMHQKLQRKNNEHPKTHKNNDKENEPSNQKI